MPQPLLSNDHLREVVALVEEFYRKGYRPPGINAPGRSALMAAAEEAVRRGLVRSDNTFRSRFARAASAGIHPDESLYAPARYNQPLPKVRTQHAPAPDPDASVPSGDPVDVLVIPDTHQCPHHPHRIEAMKWIGRFGAERRTPFAVQLGDWSTWDSVSKHDRDDTLKGRLKPSITADMDNLQESHKAFHKGKGDWRPKLLCTYGNHEYRLERFENESPACDRQFTGQRDNIFASFGWRTAPYGELRYISGVAFTHHANNGAGRAFGGKLGSTRAANESSVSIVFGHTHNWKFWPAAKIGPSSGIDILEAGCALPWGEIEAYALHSTNDWWWGVTVARLWGGRIIDFERVSMLTLREKYSDDGGDARAA